jgi:hypothetical protein
MPVAQLQEFPPSDERSTTNYDAINERLDTERNPPDGLLVHSAGFDADGTFRIYDVWESREHAERFHHERLAPLVQEMMSAGGGTPPARQEIYELHHVVFGTR